MANNKHTVSISFVQQTEFQAVDTQHLLDIAWQMGSIENDIVIDDDTESNDENFLPSNSEDEASSYFGNFDENLEESEFGDLATPLLNTNGEENDELQQDRQGLLFFLTSTWNKLFQDSDSLEVAIAALYLKDHEHSRSCSLSSNISEITPLQIHMVKLRYSYIWQYCILIALLCLFLASCFEGKSGWGNDKNRGEINFALTLSSVIIFTIDVIMRSIHDMEDTNESSAVDNSRISDMESCESTSQKRRLRARRWKKPLLIMLFANALESFLNMKEEQNEYMWSGFLKPIAFFYVSTKARDALTALYYVSIIVFRVIFIELFLLLSFSAMACHLYFDFDAFIDLPTSFLSLFEIQTAAATPSLWIPVYSQDKSSAIFFVLFLIICVFFVHSIVLSVVFQTYIHSMKTIRERALADRQEALILSFTALLGGDTEASIQVSCIETAKVRQVVKSIRPHYNSSKIDALMHILEPNGLTEITFQEYKVRMPKLLRTSLRSTRRPTSHSVFLGSLTVFVAIANVTYVMLYSSPLEFLLLSNLIFPVGGTIAILGLVEVCLRLRICSCLRDLSTSRHKFLDGLAIFASLVSIFGVLQHLLNDTMGLQALLLGRAIDMIRMLRVSSIFQSIVKRSGEVLPAIVGPLALVLSCLHLYTYSGMLIWGGAVSVGQHNDSVVPLYDLNNFNDYPSGLLTMFNIFVVNDWQTIAGVYLSADRYSSPYIVYPFFIGANLIGVNILLNVLTAFFVGAFVTKVEKSGHRTNSLNISMSTGLDVSSANLTVNASHSQDNRPNYHIRNRRSYDHVISTITGEEDKDLFKKANEMLSTFERLSGRNKIGYLLCTSRDTDRVMNTAFKSICGEYLDIYELNSIITELYTTLCNSQDGIEIRKDYTAKNEDDSVMTMAASLCCKNPNIMLLVAQIK